MGAFVNRTYKPVTGLETHVNNQLCFYCVIQSSDLGCSITLEKEKEKDSVFHNL